MEGRVRILRNHVRIFLSGMLIILVLKPFFPAGTVFCQSTANTKQNVVELFSPSDISVQGFLGEELKSSESGRLMALPSWQGGALISLFTSESRLNNKKTDWYGEHAGKWLYATALAVARTGDTSLKSLLFSTADKLVKNQEVDGYMGTYSPEQRLTNDAVSHKRSWDVWNMSYMVLGLLEVNGYFPRMAYANAAKRIGELFLRTFGDGTRPLTGFGTRDGISATVALDPVVELYKLTHDNRYLELAKLIVHEMNEKEGLMLIQVTLNHRDLSAVGDGKAYQIIWNLKALAGLYEITGNEDYLTAAKNGWKNILDNHLTICGGPWGGIGNFYECFDRPGFWSPYGFVETCSSMAWIQLNKELFRITGLACYLQEIEKTMYNALSGAAYPDGIEWCYHSFANGRRHEANFNDCCPSSGAMALEEVAGLIYSKMKGGVSCNLYTESEANIEVGNGMVHLRQNTSYPFDGHVEINLLMERKSGFPLFLRIPEWADSVLIKVNGKAVKNGIVSGEFFRIEQPWEKENKIEISFPLHLKINHRSEYATVPQSKKDIYRADWFSLSRGPLVYATNGLIEGANREKVITLPRGNPESYLIPVDPGNGFHGPAWELRLPDSTPLVFLPYYEAGGRTDGTWRLTWVMDSLTR